MIVKAWSTFNISSAQKVTSANYSTVLARGTNPTIRMTANSRDVVGDLIKGNQTYVAYVFAVGKGNNTSALSYSSATISLNTNTVVVAPSNVQVSDVSDYSDGRDLAVSFNKVSDESKVSSYRIFVVKATNYSSLIWRQQMLLAVQITHRSTKQAPILPRSYRLERGMWMVPSLRRELVTVCLLWG